MDSFKEIMSTMRKCSNNATESQKPSGLYFGKVTSVSPIQITIDPKHVLSEEFIALGRYITEYSTDLTIEGETWYGLRPDDELMLIREQGGQKYAVVDWVYRADEDTRPAWICTGEVLSGAPTIKVNDYLTLTPADLILCRNVTEHYIDMSVSHETETEEGHLNPPAGGGLPHLHEYKDRKKFLVHNGLVAGDKVLLVCQRSLQKWYVVDFIERNQSEVRGEWI